MILPIYLYGHPVLKKRAVDINSDYPDLEGLISNMWETMYFAKGVGLAAPQVGLSIRLFVIDTTAYSEEKNESTGIKQVFINPTILKETGLEWPFEEGCLSIPNIHAEVERHEELTIRFQDEQFNWQEISYDDMNARVIQHEYDHIDGVLFIERIDPLRKQLLKRKLDKIRKGIHEAKYPVRTMGK
ncbi:MAG: peptide deformylase [Bacteroidota bacterium]|nr:peptide deformylase [Bacteroidota bacterium]